MIGQLYVIRAQAQALNSQIDKRQRQFEKVIEEWKRRVADQQTEIDRWQKECRNQAAEVYRVRGQVEEAQQAVEVMRKENKNLTGE